MQKRTLAAVAAVGIASAIAIPTIAFGNARRNDAAGSLAYLKAAQTPYLARMTGAAELPTAGDTDGTGAAAITFDIVTPGDPVNGAQGCWDLSYSGLTGTPTAAHIHRGAAGSSGPVVFPATGFTGITANSASGCAPLDPALATEIMTTPAAFYVNVHTTDFPDGAIRGQLAAGPAPAGEIHMLPAPLRAYDSRDSSGAKIAVNETRTVSLATGKDGSSNVVMAVPPGATAAIVNLTVTATGTGVGGDGGFLTMYAADQSLPATSSINWAGADQNVAVTAQVAVNAAGQIKVTDGANATHFVVDVIGYLF